jgi:hypothetical protein
VHCGDGCAAFAQTKAYDEIVGDGARGRDRSAQVCPLCFARKL